MDNGAYPTLWGIVKHHLQPTASLADWTRDLAALPDVPHLSNLDFLVWDDSREMAFRTGNGPVPQDLSDNEINDIIAFLNSLTCKSAKTGILGIPDTVPSGLPIDRLAPITQTEHSAASCVFKPQRIRYFLMISGGSCAVTFGGISENGSTLTKHVCADGPCPSFEVPYPGQNIRISMLTQTRRV